MSREFPQNQVSQPPLSPTERSNTANLTEISNIQGQNDERNNHFSHQDLSHTTQAFNDMKANYEELIGKFSNSPLSSGSNSSNSINAFPNKSPTYIGDISSNFLSDENAELEVQQWGIMWTHLVSMITQVIPYQQSNLNLPKTGNEKRAILVDLVSKLCENATNPKIIEDYNILKKKYQKNKKSLKKLREQGEALMIDVKRNKELLNQHLEKFNQNDDYKLNQKIKQLEDLLKKQVQGQAELLSMDLQQQNCQSSKRFLSNKSQSQNQSISTNYFNNDDIAIEEEEEDIEGAVNEEAQNLINTMKKTEKVIKKQIKLQNQNASKSASRNLNKKNKNKIKKNHHKKEVEIEYDYEYDNDNDDPEPYSSDDDERHNTIQQSRKTNHHHKHQISNNKRTKINFEQNKKHSSNISQSRAQTQIQINKNDLFSSSSSSSLSSKSEDKYIDSKRSEKGKQLKQKSKKTISKSKINDTIDNLDESIEDNNQKSKKIQIKTKVKSNTLNSKTTNKAEKIRFRHDDADSEELEFNNNNTGAINITKRTKRKNSPDLQMRKALGDDVNQLVVVANSLKKDYKRLRKALGNDSTGSEISIEQLSRIHDSLISVENQFDNISE